MADHEAEKGVLYLVATPIGNLGDLSRRAEGILAGCDLVAAEDTRVTRGLLSHLGLHKPLVSCHSHNERDRGGDIVRALGAGKAVALVSDAGTPGVSDPGYEAAVAAIAAGHKVVAIPGPSAVLTALAASGLPPAPFYFMGFPPREAKLRRAAFTALKALPATLVFYEAPHRLKETLGDALEALGDRPAVLGRELTKKFEEYRRGCLASLAADCGTIRGEYTVVVGPPAPGAETPGPETPATLEEVLARELAGGKTLNQAVAAASRAMNLPRAEVYRKAHDMQG